MTGVVLMIGGGLLGLALAVGVLLLLRRSRARRDDRSAHRGFCLYCPWTVTGPVDTDVLVIHAALTEHIRARHGGIA